MKCKVLEFAFWTSFTNSTNTVTIKRLKVFLLLWFKCSDLRRELQNSCQLSQFSQESPVFHFLPLVFSQFMTNLHTFYPSQLIIFLNYITKQCHSSYFIPQFSFKDLEHDHFNLKTEFIPEAAQSKIVDTHKVVVAGTTKPSSEETLRLDTCRARRTQTASVMKCKKWLLKDEVERVTCIQAEFLKQQLEVQSQEPLLTVSSCSQSLR